MNKLTIIFCEGDHDIAFLSRILYIHGFEPYKKKIKEFLVPLNKLYKMILENKKIEDIEFKFQKPNQKIPYTVLIKDENHFVIFHNLSGDGNILNKKAEEITQEYIALNNENRRKIEKYEKLNYRFLYFLDADEKGVSERLEQMKILLDYSELEHCTLAKKDDYEVGCYIFHDNTHPNLEGKLEDVLLALMKSNNEDIFKNSGSFIEDNQLGDTRQRKFICTQKEEKTSGSIQFKKEKSLISVAGQLQFSGSSNSVIIANSDYIKKADILNNAHCQNIMQLF